MSKVIAVIIGVIIGIILIMILVPIGILLYHYAIWWSDRIERYFAEKELKEIVKFKNKL